MGEIVGNVRIISKLILEKIGCEDVGWIYRCDI
jgi:hypothetical protein